MRRVFGARNGWAWIPRRFSLFPTRPLSTNNKPTAPSSAGGGDKTDRSLSTNDDPYRQLDKLDFMTAAKILFTPPPQKKKFGLDFHLVQLFFACMPSLAVFLVAQYARYEMRRMEAELEAKTKAEEEAKAKEAELAEAEKKEEDPRSELSDVKMRLGKLEEAVKEIAVESKKQLDKTSKGSLENTKNGKNGARSEASNSEAKDHSSKQKLVDKAPSSSQLDSGATT